MVTVSSESEPESDLEAKRIRREQKRIRGVLPASWLKIDFRAQKPREVPAASTRQRSPSTSPERHQPQKGVAHRISRRSVPVDGCAFPIASGEENDSGTSVRSLARLKQRKLDANSTRLKLGQQSTFDDDVMENDFVDPMLAGPARSRGAKQSRGHQPRITQAFPEGLRTDFSEERSSRKQAPISRRHGIPKSTTRRRACASPPAPVRLSITDAFDDPEPGEAQLPSFVRLALRQTRHRHDRGRHSPTHKVVRLATADETEDASATLRAWRESAIVQRVGRQRTRSAGNGYMPFQGQAARVALAEISGNQRTLATYDSLDQGIRQLRPRELAGREEVIEELTSPQALRTVDGVETATKATSKRRLRSGMRPLRLRDAQLESLERCFDQNHRSAVFERRMQCMTEQVARRARQQGEANFHLERYLHTGNALDVIAGERMKAAHNPAEDVSRTQEVHQATSIPYRPRKRQARRLNVEAREYRQPSEPLPDIAITLEDEDEPYEAPRPVLQDLGPFGTRYSNSFDIRPLQSGTFFDQNTFVGSGELSDALALTQHDLNQQRGCMRVHLGAEILSWGVWQDEVAVHFVRIATSIGNTLGGHGSVLEQQASRLSSHEITEVASYLLRSVIRYLAQCVYFSDPIDRLTCVESISQLVTTLSETFVEHQSTADAAMAVTRIMQYSTILAKQALHLCDHSVIPAAMETGVKKLLLSIAQRLASHAVRNHVGELRSAYEDSHMSDHHETGFKDVVPTLSSMVILRNVLQDTSGLTVDFWAVARAFFNPENAATCSVKHLEKAWYDLFTILPALTFDSHGISRDNALSADTTAAWTLPQLLLKRVFDLYEASSAVRCASVNDYVRVLLSRCHSLVVTWGYWQSDLALSTIYDFFAQRNLHLLNSEEDRGSPSFLEDFGSEAFLQIQPDDRSFHIFLKILAASLKGMQSHSIPLRKIQSIVFRLTPNHARTYRKDATLVKADLEALRNHYDLLCTLYCAAPVGSRPSVYLLQNLVDHSSSHREACRASVRAWAHVAAFQAASDQSIDSLTSLIDWYSDMVNTTITQYRLAKSEAERDFEVAQSEALEAGSDMPFAILESTIANNQVQIAATLLDALAGLKRTLQSTSSVKTAKALVEGTGFMSTLELFDPAQRRLLSTMLEALAIVNAALDAESRPTNSVSQSEGSEDSQEFGDFDALQAFVEDDTGLEDDQVTLAGTFLAPIGHFLSNVFGADAAADDTLLMTTVDTWSRIAGCTSVAHRRSWHSYVDEYSSTSWNQMRDTSHKRKYTTYFLSRLVEQSKGSDDIKQAVLTTWLLSLVEREATLKFQHLLTATILEHWSNEPLLRNLPFASERDGSKYHITLTQLRERRVALVSSILCNMREHYNYSIRFSRSRSPELRSTYGIMLRQMMSVMKNYYQELQSTVNVEVADAGATGAYVNFVQQIVASLQQFTLDISPVDRFFLDSSAFPLPAGDPTYVVGRLRSYAPKLQESHGRAQLAVFVQSVMERALVDGQQDYLIDQMSTAMVGVDMLSCQLPTLWQVMSHSLLTVYISRSFETQSSWIAVVLLLQACIRAAPKIFYNIDIGDGAMVQAAITSLGSVLHSISQQVATVLSQSTLLDSAHALKVLGAMLMVGQASTTFIAFLEQSTAAGKELAAHLKVLRSQARALRTQLTSPERDHLMDLPAVAPSPDCIWQDTKNFTEKQLKETVETNWYSDGSAYFVRRGNTSKRLAVQLDSAEVGRNVLLQIIREFSNTYDATSDHRCRQRQARRQCDDILSKLHV